MKRVKGGQHGTTPTTHRLELTSVYVCRAQLAAELKELGKSLADTAAFIEEVEMRQGWTPRPQDGRGIERMRSLGKRLQHFAEAAVRRSPHTWVAYVLTAICSSRHKARPQHRRSLSAKVKMSRNPTTRPVRRNRRP
ncbi:hypothetical protein C8Q73DRAFT_681267 [Cubamyces lactineus]|nr:hypothetical protein C8Q73DRAFT_681267 [Cubamyces lactineus]